MSNYISVQGSTPRKRALAREIVEYCIKELMPRTTTLDISVNICKIEGDADGYCAQYDDRTFELELATGTKDPDFITAIMHEMTHVWQHRKGWLKDVSAISKYWKGEEYLTFFSTVDEYMEFPWEKSAYDMQEKLYERYNNE